MAQYWPSKDSNYGSVLPESGRQYLWMCGWYPSPFLQETCSTHIPCGLVEPRRGEHFRHGIVGQSNIGSKGSFWSAEERRVRVWSLYNMGTWSPQGFPPRKRPAPGSLRRLGLEVERAATASLRPALGGTQLHQTGGAGPPCGSQSSLSILPHLPAWNWSPAEGSSDNFPPLSDAYPGVREEDTCV